MKKIIIGFCAALGAVFSAFADVTYTPVEYIYSSSSGTTVKEFIDLAVIGKDGLEVESEMSWVSVPSDHSYLGAREGEKTATRFFVFNYGGGNGWYYGYQDYFDSKVTSAVNTKYTLHYVTTNGVQALSVDGKVIKTTSKSAGFSSNCNLYLFAANYNGTAKLGVSARCYSLKIWDHSSGTKTLVRDFIPCLDANNVPGLYDKVSGTIFYNKGTGTFGYRRYPKIEALDYYLEYIESTGKEYIDSYISAGTGYKSTCDMMFTEIPSDGCFFGAFSAGGKRSYLCYYYNNSFCWGNGSLVTLSPSVPTTVGTRNVVTMEMFSNYRYLTVNGAECKPGYMTSDPWGADTTYYIFALNNNEKVQNKVKARCYSVQMWKSSDGKHTGDLTLVGDFHPAVGVDGTIGLYDTVTKRMYGNESGTGGFIAGPKLSTGGIVVAKSSGDTIGEVTPAAGTYTDIEEGSNCTFTSSSTFYAGQNAYVCSGYTTATSEDGSVWGAESALVETLNCAHTYDGTWWRINWQWNQAGYQILATAPDGATIDAPTSTGGFAPTYYPNGTEVTFTASETDGNGGTFWAWRGDLGAVGVVETSFDRTITVTADRIRSVHAVYRHAWQWVEGSSPSKITDGIWTFDYAEGEMSAIKGADAVGTLDLTNLERDLGVKVTRTKDWPISGATHRGPAELMAFVGPDVTYVGRFTFNACELLQRVVLSPALAHIGRGAFNSCSKLEDLTPTFEQILNQVLFTEAEPYVFNGCAKVYGTDIVVNRKGDFAVPASIFDGMGIRSFDYSACRGRVTFPKTTPTGSSTVDPNQRGFAGMPNLEWIVLPRNIATLPRALLWGGPKLSKVYLAGTMPSPDNIEFFWGWENYGMTLFVSKRLNPNVVADLQLRTEPTAAELKRSDFPTEAYENGKFLGIFETPTSGWGEPEKDYTRKFYVVDWKAPSESEGLLISVW